MAQNYRVIGLMSGSSLDGLDMACCDFSYAEGQWQFSIPYAACVTYDANWTDILRRAHQLNGRDLWHAHVAFGKFCGQAVHKFVVENAIGNLLAVSSHGHTVFHEPQNGFTTQIGDGAALAAASGLPVVCDFRSLDVAKGGQGAPLVPIGDQYLFGQHAFLLNLGGIANITARKGNDIVAFDICAANQVLNFYAALKGHDYDAEGALAASGQLNAALFKQLNTLDYCHQAAPKSLGNDYARNIIIPLIDQHHLPVEDKLHTYCEHIAWQISQHILPFKPEPQATLLASGGGVFNRHLMARIQHYLSLNIVVPEQKIIQYKEALIFAFLGLLRWRGEVNISREVTGATADSIGGAIYLP